MLEKKHTRITGFFAGFGLLTWILLSSTSSAGCASQSGDDNNKPRTASALYENYCASCHGSEGEGQ